MLAVPGLDGVIRSHVQHHQEHVSYAFSGSEPSLLHELFVERARPLYSQALPVRLGRIDRSILAEHTQRKFAATGKDASPAAGLCAGAGAGHPQRTILLAWHPWERTTAGTPANADTAQLAIDDALEHRPPELEATWRALPTNERRVAVALAHGLAPLSKDAHRLTGLARSSSAQHALRSLIEHGRAEELSGGHYTLIDPLFTISLANATNGNRTGRPCTPRSATRGGSTRCRKDGNSDRIRASPDTLAVSASPVALRRRAPLRTGYVEFEITRFGARVGETDRRRHTSGRLVLGLARQ